MKNIQEVFAVRFKPERDTLVAFLSGMLVIGLSAGMLPFKDSGLERISSLVLRNLLMIYGFGFFVPVGYTLFIEKNNLSELGLTRKHLGLLLFINLLLAGLLVWVFISDIDILPSLTREKIKAVLYIMLAAGPFEILFFYGFLQLRFERAFGILPAVLLTALFYSFHHIGFQPQFGKLFMVGVMYMITFRTVRSVWIIYPFFWGVGACWDVLVQFGLPAGEIPWVDTFWIVAFFILTGIIFYYQKRG